ncbi:hypothetical protein RB2150_00035 [Rhodobacterales bacterium HTCC2150]|nr:hypothetical protein RB2150_00035 [Rhodobacterales bacterium HTCC2150] [Rhodobacteraceae bacterium HTCC2150]
MTAKRGFADLGFSTFADAAFLRICGMLVVASRRRSPIRSFAGDDFA